MWTALLSKELRECSLYAALALLAQMHFLGEGMGVPLISLLSNGRGTEEIPFVGSGRETTFTAIALIAAVVLGMHQTAWESWRQTTLLLLHRPMPRSQIFLAKILAGSLLVFAVAAVPLLIYSLWASTPGTHASPFYWGMTEAWWRSVAIAWVCYLGAFLSGIRPAYWLGSRTWPLLAATALAVVLKYVPNQLPVSSLAAMGLAYVGMLLLGSCLILSILETARLREFP
ncbi:MAG: hypothetical protein WCJ09_11515 [Planctomycetota bacterium]